MTNNSTFKQLEDLIIHSVDNPDLATPAQVLAEAGTPTTSIAILDNGKTSSHCISLLGHDEETLFQACSISKPAAGLVLMKLAELGHFSIDDRIVDRLPSDIVKILGPNAKAKIVLSQVTIKHLMSHTSGLSVHGFPGYPDPEKVPSVSDVLSGKADLANTQPVVFSAVPGLDFCYSGGGIEVLQCIMEHVMKKSFPEIMQTFLFEPLSMTRSFYNSTLMPGETNLAEAFYHGHKQCESKWHIQPELAAAGLWTTPTDLLKMFRAIQESLDEAKSNTFLKRETAQLMLTRVLGGMGLTYFVNPVSFFHGGSNNPGYRAHVFGYADLPWNARKPRKEAAEDLETLRADLPRYSGIAVMTNAAWGTAAYWKVIHAITHLKNWPEFTDLGDHGPHENPFRAKRQSISESPSQYSSDTGALVREEWREWIGKEWSSSTEDGKTTWQIGENEKGQPVAGLVGQLQLLLEPAAIPPKRFAQNKKSVDLLLAGTEILLRLGWDKDDRIVEVVNGGNGAVAVLRKAS